MIELKVDFAVLSSDLPVDFEKIQYIDRLTYTHKQSTASDTWSIKHDLGRKPSVTVVDSADSVVVGDINYIDENEIIIKFQAAFSGKAYLN